MRKHFARSMERSYQREVFGDGSWADTAHWGSQWFIFFEDNCLNNTSGREYGGFDNRFGGRHVFRYNHFYNVSWGSHGTRWTLSGRQSSRII